MQRSRFLPILILLLLATTLAAGAWAAPPVERDCDAEFPAERYNDRIDCKTENANAAMFRYVDAAIEFDRASRAMNRAPVFSDAQVSSLLASRERAQTAKVRAHQAQLFRAKVKKQKSAEEDCYIKEKLGDGKGDDAQPCEAGEVCEEVAGDGIGDDDGLCETKGRNKEVCVQICQAPPASDADNYDPEAAVEAEQEIDELSVALDEATDEITRTTARMRQAYAAMPATRAPLDCNQYAYDLFPGPVALQASQVAKNVTGAAFNGCSVVCNQDAFGWNCEAGCLVLAILDGIANAVNDGFQVAADTNDGAQMDRLTRCTTELKSNLDALAISAGNTEAALDDVQARLAAMAQQIDLLATYLTSRLDAIDTQLCTPQGQRACFPVQPGKPEAGSSVSPGKAATRTPARK
ncbi:MAG TPA: hypothetical protein VF139_05390 [Candidatus Polarisedimenticolaceae bacterium]